MDIDQRIGRSHEQWPEMSLAEIATAARDEGAGLGVEVERNERARNYVAIGPRGWRAALGRDEESGAVTVSACSLQGDQARCPLTVDDAVIELLGCVSEDVDARPRVSRCDAMAALRAMGEGE